MNSLLKVTYLIVEELETIVSLLLNTFQQTVMFPKEMLGAIL